MRSNGIRQRPQYNLTVSTTNVRFDWRVRVRDEPPQQIAKEHNQSSKHDEQKHAKEPTPPPLGNLVRVAHNGLVRCIGPGIIPFSGNLPVPTIVRVLPECAGFC